MGCWQDDKRQGTHILCLSAHLLVLSSSSIGMQCWSPVCQSLATKPPVPERQGPPSLGLFTRWVSTFTVKTERHIQTWQNHQVVVVFGKWTGWHQPGVMWIPVLLSGRSDLGSRHQGYRRHGGGWQKLHEDSLHRTKNLVSKTRVPHQNNPLSSPMVFSVTPSSKYSRGPFVSERIYCIFFYRLVQGVCITYTSKVPIWHWLSGNVRSSQNPPKLLTESYGLPKPKCQAMQTISVTAKLCNYSI